MAGQNFFDQFDGHAPSGFTIGHPDPRKAAEDARMARAADDTHTAAIHAQAAYDATHNPDGSPKVALPPMLGDPSKHGAEYLASLPENTRARVQQLLDGRSMLTTREKGQPLGQQLMDAANQADPNFDEAASKARYAARLQFTGTGKGAEIIKSADRFAAHVNDLYKLSNKMPGPNLGQSTISNLATGVAQTFDQKDVAAYNQILPLISGEVQKLTKNGSATVDEGQKIMHGLQAGQPTDVRNSAIAELVSLGRAQMQPQRDGWESAWAGSVAPPMPMDFSPATQAIFDAVESGQPALTREQDASGRDHWFTADGRPISGGGAGGGNSGPGSPLNNGGPPINGLYGPTPGTPGGPQFNPLFDGSGNGPASPGLAGGSDSEKSLPIPPDMQQAHAQYLAQHWGHIDPNDYAAFRAKLDNQYGFSPNTDAYKAIVPDLNARAANGGLPGGLNIPPINAKTNAMDRFNASVFNNPVGAGVMGAGSLGGGIDEVAAGLETPFNGRSFSENLLRANSARQAAGDAFPKSTFAGNALGTIGLALAGGGLAPGLGKFAAENPLTAGMAYGALNGALENNDNRVGGAFTGAALGAGGGAVGKYAAAPVAKLVMDTKAGQAASNLVRPGINKALGLFGSRAPQVAGTSDAVNLQPWERTLPGSNALNDVSANLRGAADLGLPYALADADPKLRMLAGSVARKSPSARDLAEQTFDPRARGQADRAVQGIDTHLAPITNIEQRGSDLLAAGDQAAGPSYNMAFSRPGPVDPQIAALLDTPAGRASLAHAHTISANRGIDPNKLGFDLNDQGEVALKSVPSFETLQMVKRGMDAHLNSFADQFGSLNLRGNPLAQSVMDLKGRFNSKLGELNPDYAEGNRIWSDFAQRKDALDQGYKVLPNNAVPQRQFDASLAGLNDNTLPEAQMGYATSMADTANKARLSANPYDAIYGSPLQQGKVNALFPEGAPKFARQYQYEGDMAKTRTETLGGSPTAARTQADQLFDSPGGMALDTAIQLKTGGGISPKAVAGLGKSLLDKYRLGLGTKKADALAPILFDTDPAKMANVVDELSLRKAQDEARRQVFNRRGGLFGTALATSLQGP